MLATTAPITAQNMSKNTAIVDPPWALSLCDDGVIRHCNRSGNDPAHEVSFMDRPMHRFVDRLGRCVRLSFAARDADVGFPLAPRTRIHLLASRDGRTRRAPGGERDLFRRPGRGASAGEEVDPDPGLAVRSPHAPAPGGPRASSGRDRPPAAPAGARAA